VGWRALVKTDVQLARVLGVSPPAVRDAARRGKIVRELDGRWDVLRVVRQWRETTRPRLQRSGQAREFRPWLDPCIPLASSVWDELVRRVDDAGAEWERR
jgi:hypothetical protein